MASTLPIRIGRQRLAKLCCRRADRLRVPFAAERWIEQHTDTLLFNDLKSNIQVSVMLVVRRQGPTNQ
jgi:hypothetical protein